MHISFSLWNNYLTNNLNKVCRFNTNMENHRHTYLVKKRERNGLHPPLLSDQATALDLFIPVLVKAATGGPNK